MDQDYTHLDLPYAYNDNIAFTVSKVVDFDQHNDGTGLDTDGAGIDDDTLVVVSYSLPIK
ncbi:MAG: hypothetical protein COA99_17755 [Moraxellaceae bacterium]|nr:MAG: hypothetical protein COA99_17755 [Moraxellaceae bacterium]